MSQVIRVFIDSDVVISSTGAAYFLINQFNLDLYISNFSVKELEIVCTRLKLGQDKLKNLIKQKLNVTNIVKNSDQLKEEFKDYTLDVNDAHIVASAVNVEAKFLITYNLRHYKLDKIKENLNLMVLTPANFLQYLRGLSK